MTHGKYHGYVEITSGLLAPGGALGNGDRRRRRGTRALQGAGCDGGDL